MTIRTRLALGFAAMAIAVALLGALSLHHLTTLHREVVEGSSHDLRGASIAGTTRPVASAAGAATPRADRILAEARATIAGLLVLACGLTGALAVTAMRATRPIDVGTACADPAPAPPEPDARHNPYADRRGPDRAVNVVRPPFGQRSATNRANGADDWEAF